MPGRKRSERGVEGKRAGAVVITKPELKRVSKPTGEYRQAICPVCGRSAGLKRTNYNQKGYSSSIAVENFWKYTQDFDPDKPFGVIQEVGGGRGRSFRVIGHFNPEDDIDGFFPLVKARLLAAVREWLNKGWIDKEEVADLLIQEKESGEVYK